MAAQHQKVVGGRASVMSGSVMGSVPVGHSGSQRASSAASTSFGTCAVTQYVPQTRPSAVLKQHALAEARHVRMIASLRTWVRALARALGRRPRALNPAAPASKGSRRQGAPSAGRPKGVGPAHGPRRAHARSKRGRRLARSAGQGEVATHSQ